MIEKDKTKRVTRVEVIDGSGRAYTMCDVTNVEVSLQDDERTLKLFVTHKSPTRERDWMKLNRWLNPFKQS